MDEITYKEGCIWYLRTIPDAYGYGYDWCCEDHGWNLKACTNVVEKKSAGAYDPRTGETLHITQPTKFY